MTGSGKTTLGTLLSQTLSLPFIDIDHYIEETNKQTIPELFKHGEAHFRMLEKEACKAVAAQFTHSVISCGGGVVLHQENIDALRETGWILFIDRPIEQIIQDIKIGHRPLLKDGHEKLYQLARERRDLYHSAADIKIVNDASLEEVVEKICHSLPLEITRQRSEK